MTVLRTFPFVILVACALVACGDSESSPSGGGGGDTDGSGGGDVGGMDDTDSTPTEKLLEACAIGKAAGLRYVYAGNRPGRTDQWENTHCPNCGHAVIERTGFTVRRIDLRRGHCLQCETPIPGFWDTDCVIPQENMGEPAWLVAHPAALAK